MVQTLFGYQGGGTANRDYTLYWKFTTADLNWSTVECTGVGVRFADTNHSLKIGITDGTTWLAQGFIELATIDGLNNVTFSSPITLSAGTDYYIGVISDGYFSYYAENSTDSAIYINNEDPEYREEDFDDAFNVAVQGAPIVLPGSHAWTYGFAINYTEGSSPSTSGLLSPPPMAVLRI